jgi:hypothetical protein
LLVYNLFAVDPLAHRELSHFGQEDQLEIAIFHLHKLSISGQAAGPILMVLDQLLQHN